MRKLLYLLTLILISYSAIGQGKKPNTIARSKFAPPLPAACQNLPTYQYNKADKIYYSGSLKLNKTDNLIDSLLILKVSSDEYLMVKMSDDLPNNISGTYQYIDKGSTLNANLTISIITNKEGQASMNVMLSNLFVIVPDTKSAFPFERFIELYKDWNLKPEVVSLLCTIQTKYDQRLKDLIEAYKDKATAVQTKALN